MKEANTGKCFYLLSPGQQTLHEDNEHIKPYARHQSTRFLYVCTPDLFILFLCVKTQSNVAVF